MMENYIHPPPNIITMVTRCQHKYLELMRFFKLILSKIELLVFPMQINHFDLLPQNSFNSILNILEM